MTVRFISTESGGDCLDVDGFLRTSLTTLDWRQDMVCWLGLSGNYFVISPNAL